MMNNKIKILFFTKLPIDKERIEALKLLLENKKIEIKAVIVEKIIHLPIIKFIFKTIKRILKGNVRIHDVIRWGLIYLRQTFISYCKQSTNKNSLESLLDKNNVSLFVVRNVEKEDIIDLVKSLNPDLGVIYVHRILNKELFSIPKLFTINLHPGILPKYAGGEPSFWSLIDGSNEVGLTVYKVTEIADKGKIILIKKIPIGNDHSYKSLNRKVKKLAPQTLLESILKIKNESDPFILTGNGKRLYRKPPSLFTKLKYRKFL